MQTHSLRQIGIIGCLFSLSYTLMGLFNSALSQNLLPDEAYRAVAQQLGPWIDKEIRQKGVPALSIALVDDDRIVWAAGFGFQDADRTEPATATTVYRVGSISKLLNDVAVMQLVQKGQLSLDSDIRETLPDFVPENPYTSPVTLRSLMNHTSGLVREPPVGNYFDATEPSLKSTVLSLNDTRLVFEPGTRTKYSNAAVSVAGFVIEHVTGKPYENLIAESLLDPLEMSSSAFVINEDLQARLAYSEMWSYDGRRFPAPGFRLGTIPAGNLYSTVVDLSHFMSAIFGGGQFQGKQVIDESLLTEMLEPQTGPDGQQRSYGIGFRLGELGGNKTFEHGGAVYGFATQFRGLPEQKIGVITAASLDVSNGLVNRVSNTALEMMLKVKQKQAIHLPSSTTALEQAMVAKSAGRYADDSREIELIENAGRLLLQAGAYQTEIRRDADRLVIDDVLDYGTPIEITDDAVILNGRKWKRLSNDKPDPAPDRFAGLIGEYGWDHNTLFIYEKQGQLWALIEWVFHYPLTEVTKNVFSFPDYGLYHDEGLEFVRDEQGVATQVTAAEVLFPRRQAGPDQGVTFRIQPRLPAHRLREIAQSSDPPVEAGSFAESDLVELTSFDDSIKLDIRYATTNNFMGMEFYEEPRAFMQRPAAAALAGAHRELKSMGYGLMIYDAYRPWFVTKMFWEATPDEMRHFVANPERGSRHNRGCAVDLTLYDLETGKVIPMVAGYDEFTERAYPHYTGGTDRQRWHRRLLRDVMSRHGFSVYEYEWWHFDFHQWQNYPIMNEPFDTLRRQMPTP